jgi:single-strand DNA-binding protein
MGKSVNKVILVGRLGRDPEMKYTSGGKPFCRFSIATDDSWTDKGSGEKQQRTEWHSLVAWDRTAEICNQYLQKGSQVYIEGSLQTREWDDKEGVKRKTTEINVRDVTFLGGNRESAGDGGADRQRAAEGFGGARTGGGITDDDIPF